MYSAKVHFILVFLIFIIGLIHASFIFFKNFKDDVSDLNKVFSGQNSINERINKLGDKKQHKYLLIFIIYAVIGLAFCILFFPGEFQLTPTPK